MDWEAVLPLMPPAGVITFVIGLSIWYYRSYYRSGRALDNRLRQIADALDSINKEPSPKRKGLLDAVFEGDDLEHCWKEYAETLHDQYDVVNGERKVARTRSTVASAYFFSAQSVVEGRLGSEFFKHLPGILTGIGIIGTFLGLIIGLYHFDPSDPLKVNESVARLLKDVFYAFIGSSVAITASILVTLSEKKKLNTCYQQLDKVTERIDQLVEGGVGEEYLADLVRSSNESSVQTRQLKDSLVTDLREMLQNLVDTQVQENIKLGQTLKEAYQASGKEMAETIGGAIENSLKEPLETIASAVQTASGEQGSQVQSLLQDVMVAFMSKLESTFGQQFNGLHEMMGQSVNAMQSMQQGFASLIQDMRTAAESSSQQSATMMTQLLTDMQAGQRAMQTGMSEMLASLQSSIASIGHQGAEAGSRMAEQLERLFAESEARQRQVSESLNDFIKAMQSGMGKSQEDTLAKMADAVTALGDQLDQMFKRMEAGRSEMDSAAQNTQARLIETSQVAVGQLDQQVQKLLETVVEQNQSAKQTIQDLSRQTDQHLREMQTGADKMKAAAERFETAGTSVSAAAEATGSAMVVMNEASTAVAGASRELGVIVSDYRNNREAMAKTLMEIEKIINGAQSEASIRADFLKDLKGQSDKLQLLNQEIKDYLNSVSDVLGKGFGEFTTGMNQSLQKTMGSLDAEMSPAVVGLAGGVESVKESLDDLSDILDRVRR
ncbi:MAG: type I Zorya anti-phage system protein ZorA1 [Moraxellaceae bacterium]|nr:type I Zorya anti-phage system protein ZorA1 [Moraxellaceae bacterium]